MTKVEQVARALAQTLATRYNCRIELWLNEARLEEARAAIEAMKEPTEGMAAAFDCNYNWTGSGDYNKAWNAMIEAALKER